MFRMLALQDSKWAHNHVDISKSSHAQLLGCLFQLFEIGFLYFKCSKALVIRVSLCYDLLMCG